ncbi:hypothetical protein B0T16DRAFT_452995 [Cercophora newfieldiana]|uniref:TEA domain-containing protein n=1 Tax=Cercophora newfieldiana TaxID=92897 RepID=A0AA40D0S1_9PEZI|nr:hypothetical protein B0T16DRAFT_452995 [Cercophora newfieldiana]
MDLPLRVPVLASQCYSPTIEYPLESCHDSIGARQPLGESTGNAQRQRARLRAALLGRPYIHRSMPPSILVPPIVPTQALGSTYGSSTLGKLQDRHQERRRSGTVNPLFYCQPFQAYRKKQDEKDDKSDQKWPQLLEDAFLDALLLIPHIGRKKFSVRQQLYGRNMLISEYLWLTYCADLPAGTVPDTSVHRERKQVSSHIQVLKNIFKNYKYCHIFLPKEIKKKDTEDPDPVSLKRHPVLVAISEGRLPDERPNYEYFARILALDEHIVVRPKRCWIFVSNRDVAVREDGSGFLAATGEKLARDQYPHIERNLEREKWAKEEQQIFQGTLLHEYTKSFNQVESSALRELADEWKGPFPDLHQRLEAMMAENAQNDILATESQCDFIHMQVMLELNEKRRFPSHSELNSWVEISIDKPHLLHHRWKVETRLVRPAELSYTNGRSAPEPVYKTSAEIAVQYQHRPGCEGPRNGAVDCHCMSQHARRDWVTVPFPADVWAPTLSNCAEYPAHPFIGSSSSRRRAKKVKRDSDDDEDSKSGSDNQYPTQMDLVPQIAMMQEIWSCPPDAAHEGDAESQGNQRWTRRGVILWSFKTIHSIDPKDPQKVVRAEGGKTSWRFLTVLDPVSEYHLQNSLLPGDGSCTGANYGENAPQNNNRHFPAGLSTALGRDAIMSPSPTFQQHLSASMSENFSSAWASSGVLGAMRAQAYDSQMLGQTTSPSTSQATSYGLLSQYGSHSYSGLATPPPSAYLTNSFSQSFETTTSGDHAVAYLTAGPQAMVGETSSAHSYMGAPGAQGFDVVAYGDAAQGMSGWGNNAVAGMETGSWTHSHSGPAAVSWGSTSGHGHAQHPWTAESTPIEEPPHAHWRVSGASSASHHAHAHAHAHNSGIWQGHGHGTETATRSSSSATATDDEHDEGSQGWEHVAGPGSANSGGGAVSDISHEWDDIEGEGDVSRVSHVSGSTEGEDDVWPTGRLYHAFACIKKAFLVASHVFSIGDEGLPQCLENHANN